MQKLIVVCAGSSIWQQERRLQGTVPLPLTESDRQSLRELAAVIEREQPDFLYSSGNESSGSTAAYLAELCRLPARTDYDLHEWNCGLWQSLRLDEIKARFPSAYRMWRSHPAHVVPPNGESLEEAGQRLGEAIKSIQLKHRGKTVVIVGAPLIMGLLECMLCRMDFNSLWSVVDSQSPLRILTPECTASDSHRNRPRQPRIIHIHTINSSVSPLRNHPGQYGSSYRINSL